MDLNYLFRAIARVAQGVKAPLGRSADLRVFLGVKGPVKGANSFQYFLTDPRRWCNAVLSRGRLMHRSFETPRVHHAARWHGSLAARGVRAAARPPQLVRVRENASLGAARQTQRHGQGNPAGRIQ
jgi:hypothetical protein